MNSAEFKQRMAAAGSVAGCQRVFAECWPQVRGTLPELMDALSAADARLDALYEDRCAIGGRGSVAIELQAA